MGKPMYLGFPVLSDSRGGTLRNNEPHTHGLSKIFGQTVNFAVKLKLGHGHWILYGNF